MKRDSDDRSLRVVMALTAVAAIAAAAAAVPTDDPPAGSVPAACLPAACLPVARVDPAPRRADPPRSDRASTVCDTSASSSTFARAGGALVYRRIGSARTGRCGPAALAPPVRMRPEAP